MQSCGFVAADGSPCPAAGDHLCDARAEHVRDFFAAYLVHVKGAYAGKPLILEEWQYRDIVHPLFGAVLWSAERGAYIRRYSVAWIEIARKNGKSLLLAGIMLYLLVADGEAGAELYGVARDKRQGALVYEVAKTMVRLSPRLRAAIKTPESIKKMLYPKSNSFYEVISSDADTALGSNPHGVGADEICAWRDGSMWMALETGMGSGARLQPLLAAATTAGTTNSGFAEKMHGTMLRILDNPKLSPHTFVYARNTPADADIWDEANWYHANPALGTFLSLESFRKAAADARMDPEREQAFRQFRLNQWTRSSFRWMDMAAYDAANTAPAWSRGDEGLESLHGLGAFVGLDLSAKLDLTSVCWLFPDSPFGPAFVWRHYVPEEAFDALNAHDDDRYARFAAEGWLTVVDGAVIDYDLIVADLAADAKRFKPQGLDADEWSSWPVITAASKALGLSPETQVAAYKSTFDRMSPGLSHLTELVKSRRMAHFGNPLSRYLFESTEVRRSPMNPDLLRPDKPARDTEWRRIDAVPAAAMAANAWKDRGATPKRRSAYADGHGVVIA